MNILRNAFNYNATICTFISFAFLNYGKKELCNAPYILTNINEYSEL